MKPDLQGKVALVTGGSTGIGAATVELLAQRGAKVAFTCLASDQMGAATFTGELKAKGLEIVCYPADVTDFEKARQVVEKINQELGGLDILVNNAGINRDRVLWKMTEQDWDMVLDVDLKGPFNYMGAVAPFFKTQASGRIITISSINGLRGKFGQANYTAAKAGVVGLSKTVARELARYQVTVNVVCPGLVDTEMAQAMPDEKRKESIQEIPLGRMATPTDIAETVAFLASDRARHITGQVIQVDGGQYL